MTFIEQRRTLILQHRRLVLVSVAVRCSALQSCCRVIQSVAECCRVLQSVAECCRVLQCVAVCCSVLQSVAVCYSPTFIQQRRTFILRHRRPVLVCVAERCSALQSFCSVLQCVPVVTFIEQSRTLIL